MIKKLFKVNFHSIGKQASEVNDLQKLINEL